MNLWFLQIFGSSLFSAKLLDKSLLAKNKTLHNQVLLPISMLRIYHHFGLTKCCFKNSSMAVKALCRLR
jgi:hypothetical protein